MPCLTAKARRKMYDYIFIDVAYRNCRGCLREKRQLGSKNVASHSRSDWFLVRCECCPRKSNLTCISHHPRVSVVSGCVRTKWGWQIWPAIYVREHSVTLIPLNCICYKEIYVRGLCNFAICMYAFPCLSLYIAVMFSYLSKYLQLHN